MLFGELIITNISYFVIVKRIIYPPEGDSA